MKKLLFLLLVAMALPAMAQDRPKVGLVLGGGGAKGAAEVGVLYAIERSGIPIDYIAGTSIGSIVGGLYSCGLRAKEIEKLFRSQQWLDLLTDRDPELRGDPVKKRDGVTYVFGYPIKATKKAKKKRENTAAGPGFLRGDRVMALLDSLSGHSEPMKFDSLPIPFRCVAVNLDEMEEVVLDSGRLAQCMRASMAIPGAFKPVEMDDQTLVDGGTLNNLPVDVVRAMGADVVIAVDLTQNKRETRDKEMPNLPGQIGKLIGWIATRPDLKKYNQNRADCDVYINPALENYDAMDFNAEKIDEMISLGIDAGQDAYQDLLKLKEKVCGISL